MLDAGAQNSDERPYLDDLFVGQPFTSRTHVIDEAQIKAFWSLMVWMAPTG